MNNSPITVVGNVTADPKVSQGNNTKASFSVAVDHRFKRGDDWETKTSFFNVVCWRYVADDVARHVAKGTPVVVTGRLEQRKWESDDGPRNIVELIADSVGINLKGIATWERKTSSGSAASSSKSFAAPEEAPF